MTQPVAAPASGRDRAGAKPRAPARSPETVPDVARPAPLEKRWFRLPLAAAYAAPFIIAGATLSLVPEDAPRETQEELLGLALASLVLPPIVRVAYDDARGIPLELLGTLGSVAAGGVTGLLVGVATCDEDNDECIGEPIVDAAVGLIVGYGLWAIVDTVFFAYAPSSEPSAAPAARATSGWVARPVLTPVLAPRRPGRGEGARDGVSLAGLTLGVALRF
jgi:hypothetical protein